jgi:acyl carrier protein
VTVDVPDVPRSIEDVVAAHPDVNEVAVVSLNGEGPAALTAAVVPVDFASGPEIRDFAWERLGDDHGPAAVALLPALPRGADGQVDRAELRRVLTEDDPPTSRYAAPRPGLEQEVAEILREVLDVPRVGLDDDFLELGGDSLQAIEVTNLLEERTGRQVPLEVFFEAATVRNLCAAVVDG